MGSIYRNVRKYRSKRIESVAEADIRITLHMYDDALSSDFWTTAANFYYVCENTLSPGYNEKDQVIAESTGMTVEGVGAWREMVTRVKHPTRARKMEYLTGTVWRFHRYGKCDPPQFRPQANDEEMRE